MAPNRQAVCNGGFRPIIFCMKLRLFVGIAAPPDWKTVLSQWRRGVQPKFGNSFGRWTAESNLHLTLRFFGAVEEAEVPAMGAVLQKLTSETHSFNLLPGSLGCFPNPSRPRIVWIGFRESARALVDLESRLHAETARFGQPPEDRDFHPHLTLLRVNDARRSDRETLAELIRKGPPIEAPAWQVREIELIQSELKPSGSVYTTLGSYPLASAD
jgi:2'-5' RNA ligase